LASFSWQSFLSFTAFLALYSLVSWLVLYTLYLRVTAIDLGVLFLVLDIFVWTAAVYCSGGDQGWLFFILVMRAADQANTDFRRVLYFAHVPVLSYGGMLFYIHDVDGQPIAWAAALTKLLYIYAGNLYISLTARTAERRRDRTVAAIRMARELLLQRQAAEEALRAAHDELELRVQERTAALAQANAALRTEVAVRQQMEEQVQEQRKWLEVTLASIGDGVIATDTRARIAFMNPVAEQLTGWSAQEGLGREIGEVFHVVDEQTRQAVEIPVTHALREGIGTSLANHSVLVNRHRQEIPIANSGAPIRSSDGTVYGAVTVFQDITARRQGELELLESKRAAEAADRTKSEFLATMSHELRTPLHVVLGYTDLLIEGHFGVLEEQQRESLYRIKRNADELSDLISALLDVSRLEAGRLPVEMKEVSVAALLQEIRKETQELQDQSPVEFVWRTEPDFPLLYTDAGKLKIVVKNLITNAVKFTEAGSITVQARPHAEGAEITVRDTGVGIPADALALIFEPFQQIANSSKVQRKGTGLGLTIVKRLLELLGGTVSVESEQHRGSTFRIWLPIGRDVSRL
jgi:PAS domain S-box-containing protein